MSAGLNDNELIAQVLAGHQPAYALLVERYRDFVFTLSLRFIRNREDAEEVAQDIFVKAYRSLADFRGDAKFSTWLYTIVNTTCISFLRKKKIVHHSLDSELVFEAADNLGSGTQASLAEQKSRAALVGRAIALLSTDDAQIITLFYKGEQTVEEIAGILGIAPNAAKVRLHRARTRLREKMEIHFAREVKELN